MPKEVKIVLAYLRDGFESFASYPFAGPYAAKPCPPPKAKGIGRHFAKAGQRISKACEAYAEGTRK